MVPSTIIDFIIKLLIKWIQELNKNPISIGQYEWNDNHKNNFSLYFRIMLREVI